MKKSIRLLSLLMVAVMLAAIMPFGAMATTTALKNKTVIAFGDSLTALGNPTYVGYLSDLLGIDVINAGVGGNMTAHGKARFQTDVLSKNPDVVLLCFGMNDQACSLPSGQSWTSIETYRIDMGYFITELQKIGCEVVLITPNPVCDETGYYVAPADGTYTYNYPGSLDKFCTAMRELALEYGCTLVDMNQEFKLLKDSDISTFKSYYGAGDGIHQSQLGRQFWANKINAHLNAIFDNVNKSTITVNCVDENNNVIKSYSYVGAKDSNLVIAPPALPAFATDDASVSVKFGATASTVTFNFESTITPLLKQVESIDETKYTATTLSLINGEYNKAKALLAADVIDFEALEKCAKTLEYYLSVTGDSTVVISMGSSYTRPEPNYYKWDSATQAPSTELNDLYSDDYVRLTDGVKASVPANSSAYSAWQSDATIVIDLGSEVESNVYRGYFASGMWGVATPADMKVYYSNDKTSWTAIDKAVTKTVVVDGGSDGWSSTEYAVSLDDTVSARYIKFEISKTGSFVWVDEIEVGVGVSTVDNLNLAYGKTYEKSPLFRQSNITWDWDETFPEAYPDENGTSLTDGIVSTANDLGDVAWVGFNAKTPAVKDLGYNYIKVDLGEVYGLTQLALHVGSNGLGYGITAPNVEFFVSEDGETYTSVGSAKGANAGNTTETLAVECEANARYIEARITGTGWEFVSEIFAYGGEAFENTEPAPDPDPDPDPDTTPEVMKGDVNGNDEIDASDYTLLKRAYLGTYAISDITIADLNNNEEIDSVDYTLVKRAYFGTYIIQ